MLSATSWADELGPLDLLDVDVASLPVSWASSSRSLSTSAPRLPMTTPGRPVCTVIVTLPGRRSMCTSEIAAWPSRRLEVLPDQLVFLEQRRHLLGGKPARAPDAGRCPAGAQSDASSDPLLVLLVVHVNLHVAGPLPDRGGAALGGGGKPLERLTAVDDAFFTKSASGSKLSFSLSAFCSAFATADFSVLAICLAASFLLNLRMAYASFTSLPRMRSMTRRIFRGDWRTESLNRMAAHDYSGLAFLSATILPLWPRNRRVGRELAELVTHHVLGDVHRDELVPVVHREGVAHELRQRSCLPGSRSSPPASRSCC